MDLLQGDKTRLVQLICLVDLIQPTIIILARAWSIIFLYSAPINDDAYIYTDHNSSAVVILFLVLVCFYVIHMTMALKLLSTLELMELDPLLSARSAKAWQSWAIIFLVFLIGNLFASILSASAKLAIAFASISGVCEIVWRLFAIYNVGLLIDEIVKRIPNTVTLVPTVKIFGVRFPVSRNDQQDLDQQS